MTSAGVMMGLTVVSVVCWPICFWWMWRISSNQNELLRQLHEQTRRIERIARAEHDLMKDSHPKIGEIKDAIEQLTSPEAKP